MPLKGLVLDNADENKRPNLLFLPLRCLLHRDFCLYIMACKKKTKRKKNPHTHAHARTFAPRRGRSRAVGGHGDSTICCCNQTPERTTKTHAVVANRSVRTNAHAFSTRLAESMHILTSKHTRAQNSADTHFFFPEDTHTHTRKHVRARPLSVGRLGLQEALCTQLSPMQPVLISTIHLQIVMDRLLQLACTHRHTHARKLPRTLRTFHLKDQQNAVSVVRL